MMKYPVMERLLSQLNAMKKKLLKTNKTVSLKLLSNNMYEVVC